MTTPEIVHQLPAEEIVGQTAPTATSTVINKDIFADKVPADANDIHETPMGGTLASAAPLNELPAGQTPMFETPDQEIPMGGTLAAAGPMDENPAGEIPLGETVAGSDDETLIYASPAGAAVPTYTHVQKTIYQVPMGDTVPYKKPVGTDAFISQDEMPE